MHRRYGYTLLELMLVLSLATLLAATAIPSTLRGRHALAVRGARAELISTIAAARSVAILGGGAYVVLDVAARAVWIETPDGARVGDARQLGAHYGVALEYSSGPYLRLRYDALGIGRLANASVRIRRGHATATIAISAYGRVRS